MEIELCLDIDLTIVVLNDNGFIVFRFWYLNTSILCFQYLDILVFNIHTFHFSVSLFRHFSF
jgi:hypothetical protein